MKVHLQLKKELAKQGRKFTFVAEKTGIPYESLIQYLNGHRPIPEAKLRLICLSFDIPVSHFGLSDGNSLQRRAS